MYVCEDCHDKDIDVIQCGYEYNVHDHITGVEATECEICGKRMMCIFCEDYQAEMLIRARAKRGGKGHEHTDVRDTA